MGPEIYLTPDIHRRFTPVFVTDLPTTPITTCIGSLVLIDQRFLLKREFTETVYVLEEFNTRVKLIKQFRKNYKKPEVLTISPLSGLKT